MKAYIGSKIILAEPEEKNGKDGYKVVYPDGYISWSPKDVFETAYREVAEGEFDLIDDILNLKSIDLNEPQMQMSEEEIAQMNPPEEV